MTKPVTIDDLPMSPPAAGVYNCIVDSVSFGRLRSGKAYATHKLLTSSLTRPLFFHVYYKDQVHAVGDSITVHLVYKTTEDGSLYPVITEEYKP